MFPHQPVLIHHHFLPRVHQETELHPIPNVIKQHTPHVFATTEVIGAHQHAGFRMCARYARTPIQCSGTMRAHRSYRGNRREFPSSYPLSDVNISALEQLCQSHPDKDLVSYIVNGLYFGFDIGFRGLNYPTRPKNLLSARDDSERLAVAISNKLS